MSLDDRPGGFEELLRGFAVGMRVRGGGFGGLLLGAHEGEENHVADAARAGEDHGEAVDADALTGGRGQVVAEGAEGPCLEGCGSSSGPWPQGCGGAGRSSPHAPSRASGHLRHS